MDKWSDTILQLLSTFSKMILVEDRLRIGRGLVENR